MINKLDIITIIVISSLVIGLGYLSYSYAISTDNIKLDNSGRREYVYCPIDTQLLPNFTTYDINGCPTVRIYVDNWNRLTELDKNTIDSQLRGAGFKDAQ